MKVLFAASECVPFIKTGGLADVIGALPAELARQGTDARVVLPKYRIIDEYWKQRMEHVCDFSVLFGWRSMFCGVERVLDHGVTYYFIDNEELFSTDAIYGDGLAEGLRFAFFSRAVLEALPHIGFFPDVLHLNDWQTGLIAALLKTQYQDRAGFPGIKTVFSIHNLRFQGLFKWKELNGRLGFEPWLFTPEYLEFYGDLSCMKAGLVFSDRLCTVSPRYAEEICMPYYGERLDGLLRARGSALSGILNGIDTEVFDPATDRLLEHHFDAADLSGKAACKRSLQLECGLEPNENTPVIGFIARLSTQKGLDLIERVLDDILRQDVQLVFLGKGEKRFEDFLNWAAWRYGRRVHARLALDEGFAHRIYAGADLFLMPSQYEPCGLSQMIALRYGTVPIVRETGGLADSVIPYNQYTDEGTGFSFANYNAHEMLFAIERAAGLYAGDKAAWRRLMLRGMAADFSWTHAAGEYRALYDSLLPQAAKAAESAALSAGKARPAEAVQAAPAAAQKCAAAAADGAEKGADKADAAAESAEKAGKSTQNSAPRMEKVRTR